MPDLTHKNWLITTTIIFVFFSLIQWLINIAQFNSWTSYSINLMVLVLALFVLHKLNRRDIQLENENNISPNNLFEELPIALIVVNGNGDITNINSQARKICGFPAQCKTLSLYSDIVNKEHLLYYLIQTLEKRTTYHDQYFTYQKNDELKYLCLSTTEITNDEGQASGALLLAWHISEQSFLGRHLSQGGKLAMIGEIAAGTAHEIRNPLTSVKGLIQILSMRFPKNDSIQEYTTVMLKEINQINHIITELLLLARRTTPNLSFASLPAVIDNVLLLMEGEAVRKGIRFTKNYAEDMPLIVLDEDQIKQVFWHLTSNAIHSMPNGGELTVNVKYMQTEQGIEITFADTGIGIKKDDLSQIFHPFFTTRPEGTGLGLPVSYQIVDNHGGKLSVKSIVGKGTVFVVKLPLVNYEKQKTS